MRWLGVCLSLAMIAACVQIGPDAGAGGAASTACDDKGDCNACSNCARNDACRSQEAACQQNSACIGLNECLLLCNQDQFCEDDCVAGNQAGVSAYNALLTCIVCDACPNDCAGLGQCN